MATSPISKLESMGRAAHDDGCIPLEAVQNPLQHEGFLESSAPEEIPTVAIRNPVSIGGANFHYTIEFPLDPQLIQSEAVTVIAHGFGGIELAYADLRGEIARTGNVVATYDPPRSIGLVGDLNPATYKEADKLNSQAVWGVIRDISREFGYDQFDILGHSMGGKSASDAALHKPDYIRNLILHGSVGVSDHRFLGMLLKAGGVAFDEIPHAGRHLIHRHGLGVVRDAARYVLRNPVRFVAEGVITGDSDIREGLEMVRGERIKTAHVQYPADGFFSPHHVTSASSHLFHIMHEYANPRANHVTLQTDAKGVALAHLAISRGLERDAKASAGESDQLIASV